MRVASTFAVSASGSAMAPVFSQQQLHHRYLSSRLGFSCRRNIPSNFTKQSCRTRTTNLDLQGFGIGTGTGTPLFEQQRICCCQAMDQTKTQSVYQGVYGSWTVDPSDVREVISYRTGLVTAAASFVVAASTAFLPAQSFLTHTLDQYLDLFFLLGASGLGVSLFLIHIYVTEIKRTLQALWALGIVGSLLTYTALAQPAGQGLVHYIVDNPTAVWFVGPLFASLTGLVFKEGLCYGKLEAGILTFIRPTLLLGHLTGVMDEGAKLTLLGLWMALFIIFAGRKFTQPVKDDIGDKSVFMFNALPEKEKAALLEKLEQQKF